MCNCENKIHPFKCFLRNIVSDYVPGRDNYGVVMTRGGYKAE